MMSCGTSEKRRFWTVSLYKNKGSTVWLQARPKQSGYDFCHETSTGKLHCVKHPMYSVFVDLTKAFETTNRKALWTVPQRTGI